MSPMIDLAIGRARGVARQERRLELVRLIRDLAASSEVIETARERVIGYWRPIPRADFRSRWFLVKVAKGERVRLTSGAWRSFRPNARHYRVLPKARA